MSKFLIVFKKEMRSLINVQNIIPLILIFVLFYFLGDVIGGFIDGGDTIVISGEGGEAHGGGAESREINRHQIIGFIDNDNSEYSNMIRNALAEQGVLALPRSNDPEEAMRELETYTFHGEEISVGSLVVINQGFEASIRDGRFTAVDVYTAIDSFGMTNMMSGAGGQDALRTINGIISRHLLEDAEITHNVHFLINPVWANEHTYLNETVQNVHAQAVLGYVISQISFVPVIILLIIMMGTSTLATSMVNEKADKTLETLMTTPVSRMAVLTAKVLSAALLAALYAVVYIFALQNFSEGFTGGETFPDGFTEMMANFGIAFNTATFLIIGAQLFLSVLCGLAVALIIGMMVDDIKALPSYIMGVSIFTMIPYFLSMFLDINTLPMAGRIALYAIPFTHSFTAASNLFTANYTLIIIGIIYQAVFVTAMLTFAVKIFSSDKLFTLGQILSGGTKKLSRKLSFGKKQTNL